MSRMAIKKWIDMRQIDTALRPDVIIRLVIDLRPAAVGRKLFRKASG